MVQRYRLAGGTRTNPATVEAIEDGGFVRYTDYQMLEGVSRKIEREYRNLLADYEILKNKLNTIESKFNVNEPSGSGEGRGGPYGTGHYG